MRHIALILVCIAYTSHAQLAKVDTIYLSSTAQVHFLFDYEPEEVEVGSESMYGYEKYKNQLNLKAKFPNAEFPQRKPTMSTLMVRFKDSDDYYHAILKYAKVPPQFLWDKRDPELKKQKAVLDKQAKQESLNPAKQETENPTSSSSIEKESDITIIKKRKNMVMDEREKIDMVAVFKNNILIQATNIKNDPNVTYIKFKIKNKSSVDYVVDLMTFEVIEKLRKSVSKNNGIENLIEPIPGAETKFDKIPAYDEVTVVFALPIFATGDGDANSLTITLREQKGTRKIALDVPIKYFVKAEVF
jgi:hypothetical protein